MGYSTCGGMTGREKHGRTCDACDKCRKCDGLPITRVTVSGFGLAGYYCPEHIAKAKAWARDYIARNGFSPAFR